MRLDYRIPNTALRSLLSVHALVTEVEEQQIEILPAMLPNLHIRLAGSSCYSFDDGANIEAPQVCLIGPTTSAYRVTLRPGLVMMATGFLPMGWMSLARAPACALSDTLIDGADLWGDRVVETICDQLVHARSQGCCWALLERFLMGRMRVCNDTRLTPASGIDHWLETSPDLRIEDLAAMLDVGCRHLRRLTLDSHGASPKTLAMKYRCLRAAAVLSLKGAQGVDDVLPPFADQAHLIRDFRRFIGWTPGAFIDGGMNTAASTLRGRRAAGAARPLTLLS